jgi:hypothetical protein
MLKSWPTSIPSAPRFQSSRQARCRYRQRPVEDREFRQSAPRAQGPCATFCQIREHRPCIRFGETSPFWNDQPMPAIWQCPRPVFSNREGICPAPFCFCNGQAQSADGGQMISSQRPVAPGEKSRAPAITPRRFFEWRAERGFPRGNWQRATSMRGDVPDGVSPLGKTQGSKQFWEP